MMISVALCNTWTCRTFSNTAFVKDCNKSLTWWKIPKECFFKYTSLLVIAMVIVAIMWLTWSSIIFGALMPPPAYSNLCLVLPSSNYLSTSKSIGVLDDSSSDSLSLSCAYTFSLGASGGRPTSVSKNSSTLMGTFHSTCHSSMMSSTYSSVNLYRVVIHNFSLSRRAWMWMACGPIVNFAIR